MIHTSVVVKTSGLNGKGLFAATDINQGEIIWQMDLNVPKFHINIVRNMPVEKQGELLKYVMQIDEQWFIGMADGTSIEPGDFINHSCNPNTWFVKDVALAARRDIKQGEEITYDYATSDTYGLEMTCQCGSRNCRQVIKGSDYALHRDLQKIYGKHVLSHVLKAVLVGSPV
jgi:SET domain-containing protein